MNIDEKIVKFLKEQLAGRHNKLSNIKISEGTNKKGENLFIIKASNLEQKVGTTYISNATYYGFNSTGDFVGWVSANVSNIIPAKEVELEYLANEQFANQGNITLLAQEVIKEIFIDKSFDGLKVREGILPSEINEIIVDINEDNYASLAVARKLGFNEEGYLEKNEYLSRNEKISGLKR